MDWADADVFGQRCLINSSTRGSFLAAVEKTGVVLLLRALYV